MKNELPEDGLVLKCLYKPTITDRQADKKKHLKGTELPLCPSCRKWQDLKNMDDLFQLQTWEMMAVNIYSGISLNLNLFLFQLKNMTGLQPSLLAKKKPKPGERKRKRRQVQHHLHLTHSRFVVRSNESYFLTMFCRRSTNWPGRFLARVLTPRCRLVSTYTPRWSTRSRSLTRCPDTAGPGSSRR